MFATSLPVALDSGAGVPGLALTMVLIGLGVGGVKATISPFIGERKNLLQPKQLALRPNIHKAINIRNTNLGLSVKRTESWR